MKGQHLKRKKEIGIRDTEKIHLMMIYCTCAQEDVLKSKNTLNTVIIKNDIDDISNIK